MPSLLGPLRFLGDYARLVVDTNYFTWFTVFNALFFAWVALLMYVMENFFYDVDPGFSSALDSLGFLSAFVFMPYLNETLNGYNAEPVAYRAYLDQLLTVAMVCAKESAQRVLPHLNLLVDHGDYLRRRHPGSQFTPGKVSQQETKLRKDVEYKAFDEATRYLVVQLKAELDKDGGGDAAANRVFELLQAWSSREKIKEPPYMKSHILIFLFLWYGFWLPLLLWLRAGWGRALLIFPFVSYVLWGTTILRFWLGNVWDIYRPTRADPAHHTPHEEWGRQTKEALAEIAQMRA